MPDWTYYPLRGPMRLVAGDRRSVRLALSTISWLVRIPGGRAIVAGLGHTTPPLSARCDVGGIACLAPVGASVGIGAAADAVRALPPLGAALVEIGPVPITHVTRVRDILKTKRGPVIVGVAGKHATAVATALAPYADMIAVDIDTAGDSVLEQVREAVNVPVVAAARLLDVDRVPAGFGLLLRDGLPANVTELNDRHPFVLVSTSDPSIGGVADLVASGARAVLATQTSLIAAGPGWFHRGTAAILHRTGHERNDFTATHRVAWVSGVGLGFGMIAGGIGATVVALGPVLLPYDASFLGLNASSLARMNAEMIRFLQHDRITLAGTMVALGILYASLSWHGIRHGRTWARDAVLASGVVGFPTLFYFFAFHYVEPVHVALAAVLFPLFVLAVWRRPPHTLDVVDGDERPQERNRALVGQLLMVMLGLGLIGGGVTISYVGLTTVFVPSDLGFMSTTAHALAVANDRLLGFVAHDRAGFGGALVSTGVAVVLLSAWGWHRGQAWVWWCLALAGIAGFGATIAIHLWVGYTDSFHLAPVYVGTVLAAISLALSRNYLLNAPGVSAAPLTRF